MYIINSERRNNYMSKNSFGKSVISGILILTVSVAMLIGVTYAVFNDDSSTSVNTIQAGTLDIDS